MAEPQNNPRDTRNPAPFAGNTGVLGDNGEPLPPTDDYQELMDMMDVVSANAENFGSLDETVPHDADMAPAADNDQTGETASRAAAAGNVQDNGAGQTAHAGNTGANVSAQGQNADGNAVDGGIGPSATDTANRQNPAANPADNVSPRPTPSPAPSANQAQDPFMDTLVSKTTAAGKMHYMQESLSAALRKEDITLATQSANHLHRYIGTFREMPDALGWNADQLDAAIQGLNAIEVPLRNEFFQGAQQIVANQIAATAANKFKPDSRVKEDKFAKEFQKQFDQNPQAIVVNWDGVINEREQLLAGRSSEHSTAEDKNASLQSGIDRAINGADHSDTAQENNVPPSTGNKTLDTLIQNIRDNTTPVGKLHCLQESLRGALTRHDTDLSGQAATNLKRYIDTFRNTPNPFGWDADKLNAVTNTINAIKSEINGEKYDNAQQILNKDFPPVNGDKFIPGSKVKEDRFDRTLESAIDNHPQAIIDVLQGTISEREKRLGINPAEQNRRTATAQDQNDHLADASLAQSMPPDNEPLHKFLEKARHETTAAGKLYVMLEALKAVVQKQDTDLSLKTMQDMRRYVHSFATSATSLGLNDNGLMQNAVNLEQLENALQNENYTVASSLIKSMVAPQGKFLKPGSEDTKGFRNDLATYLQNAPEKVVNTINLIASNREALLNNHEGRSEAQENARDKAEGKSNREKSDKEPRQQGSGGGFSLGMNFGGNGNKDGKQVNRSAFEKYLAKREAANLSTAVPSTDALKVDELIAQCEKIVAKNGNIAEKLCQHADIKDQYDRYQMLRHHPDAANSDKALAKIDLDGAIANAQHNANGDFAPKQKELGKNADKLYTLADGIQKMVESNPELAKERRNEIKKLSRSVENMMDGLEGKNDGVDKIHPDDKGRIEKFKEKMSELAESINRIVDKLASMIKSQFKAGQ